MQLKICLEMSASFVDVVAVVPVVNILRRRTIDPLSD